MKAPDQIILPENLNVKHTPPTLPQLCRMISCFDYSRCSLVSGFPVYIYSTEVYSAPNYFNEFIKSSVLSSLKSSAYFTSDPNRACIFVVLLGESNVNPSPIDTESILIRLPYWNGDGRNHLILNVARSASNFDMLHNVNTGRAMIAQSSFVETSFRTKFDVILPPSLGRGDGPFWEELPPLAPVRRKYFLSFVGQFNVRFLEGDNNANVGDINSNHFNADHNFKSRQLNSVTSPEVNKLLGIEASIVNNLKKIVSDTKENVFIRNICDSQVGPGLNGEWNLCGSETERAETLQQTTFSILIAPANSSVPSTTVFQTRLYESLKHGAIPVILGDTVELPYSELIDWSKAVLVLPKARVAELHFYLRTFTDSNVMELKRHGRILWETYFGTSHSIVSTVLAVLRTRLQIPAAPVQEEPSPSIVSEFSPASQFVAMDTEDMTDEVLGPLEPPFPSLKYKQNYTATTLRDAFNHPGDPFHLFPFTPFEPVLPSEAKFIGKYIASVMQKNSGHNCNYFLTYQFKHV